MPKSILKAIIIYFKVMVTSNRGCAHCRRKYKEALDSAPLGTDLKGTASYFGYVL